MLQSRATIAGAFLAHAGGLAPGPPPPSSAVRPLILMKEAQRLVDPLTLFGSFAVSIMLVSYALERRSSRWILVFAFACAASALYAALAGTWPFMVVETVWSAVALRRWWTTSGRGARANPPSGP